MMRWIGGESRASSYIPTPSRERAIERLTAAAQAGEPVLTVTGASGSGKSIVVREALRRLRCPRRLTILIESPGSADDLAEQLRSGVGLRSGSLENALRLPKWQGRDCVIAVDSCRALREGVEGSMLLERLRRAAIGSAGTIVFVALDAPFLDAATIDLPMLTRAEAAIYLARADSASRPRRGAAIEWRPTAIGWMHAMARGSPRWLDWLADRARDAAIEAESKGSVVIIDEEWLERHRDRLWSLEAERLAGVETLSDLW